MKKLINYISAGQGLGLKLILIFSGLVSLVFAAYIRISGAALIPYAQDIADQMLPIKIENGIVAEPAKTIKVAHLRITEDADPIALPFIINTTVDELNTNELSSGIYLTRTAFYAVNKNEVRLYKLEDNMDLPKGDYREDFKSALTYTSIALFVIGWISLFIMYTALTFFYAGCSYAVSAIFSKRYNFNTRMRISTLCLITTYILFMTLDWLGLESGKIVFFITEMTVYFDWFSFFHHLR